MIMNPKNITELLNVIRNISQDVRKEEGCIDNFIFQSLNDENELIMIEYWKTKTLLNKHWKTTNFSALLGFQNLLNQPMNIEINNVSGTLGLAEIEKSRIGNKAKSFEKGLKVYKE